MIFLVELDQHAVIAVSAVFQFLHVSDPSRSVVSLEIVNRMDNHDETHVIRVIDGPIYSRTRTFIVEFGGSWSIQEEGDERWLISQDADGLKFIPTRVEPRLHVTQVRP